MIMKRVRSDDSDIVTFAYNDLGDPPQIDSDVYLIIDCRVLPNPWSDPKLRDLHGSDPKILQFFPSKQVDDLLNPLLLIEENKNIAFGCAHGRHRSVSMATEFKRRLTIERNCKWCGKKCIYVERCQRCIDIDRKGGEYGMCRKCNNMDLCYFLMIDDDDIIPYCRPCLKLK